MDKKSKNKPPKSTGGRSRPPNPQPRDPASQTPPPHPRPPTSRSSTVSQTASSNNPSAKLSVPNIHPELPTPESSILSTSSQHGKPAIQHPPGPKSSPRSQLSKQKFQRKALALSKLVSKSPISAPKAFETTRSKSIISLAPYRTAPIPAILATPVPVPEDPQSTIQLPAHPASQIAKPARSNKKRKTLPDGIELPSQNRRPKLDVLDWLLWNAGEESTIGIGRSRRNKRKGKKGKSKRKKKRVPLEVESSSQMSPSESTIDFAPSIISTTVHEGSADVESQKEPDHGHGVHRVHHAKSPRLSTVTKQSADDEYDEALPDQKETHRALRKLRALPVPMYQKRMHKANLGAIQQRKAEGWFRFVWSTKTGLQRITQLWEHDFSVFQLWRKSMQDIEVHCGTAIVNVFLFIRWTLMLNVFISVFVIGAMIIPYHADHAVLHKDMPGLSCPYSNNSRKEGPPQNQTYAIAPNDTSGRHSDEMIECCTLQFYHEAHDNSRGTIAVLYLLITNSTGEARSVEFGPTYFGYYYHEKPPPDSFDVFPFLYVTVIGVVLIVSFILMVRNVGTGIQEMMIAVTGEITKYTGLVFAGWDYYTRDASSAKFKRKVLCHEIKLALQGEKDTLEKERRSKKKQFRLSMVRVGVNFAVVALLLIAAGAIVGVSYLSINHKRQTREQIEGSNSGKRLANQTWTVLLESIVVGFIPSALISALNVVFPLILYRLGRPEKYSQQVATALVLFRALFIRLMSIGFAGVSLYIFAYCPIEPTTCTVCETGRSSFGKLKFRDACWENIFADHLYRLLFLDFMLKVFLAMVVEPIRIHLKKRFKHRLIQNIGTLKFSIVRHSLDIIYLQALIWVGMYFGPFMPLFGNVYTFFVFYLKRYSLLHNCNTVPETYKTTKTTTIFVAAKLIGLLAVSMTNIAVIGYMTTSKGCGPFRRYPTAWGAVREFVAKDDTLRKIYSTITSPTLAYLIVLLLSSVTYYYFSVSEAHRGMGDTLRHLLVLESQDKQYLLAKLNIVRQDESRVAMTNSITRGSKEKDVANSKDQFDDTHLRPFPT